jgi:hypothetical protein
LKWNDSLDIADQQQSSEEIGKEKDKHRCQGQELDWKYKIYEGVHDIITNPKHNWGRMETPTFTTRSSHLGGSWASNEII